ncbi:MAG: hypothetical protein AB7U83_14260 [Vicinamibacterales bacterium]
MRYDTAISRRCFDQRGRIPRRRWCAAIALALVSGCAPPPPPAPCALDPAAVAVALVRRDSPVARLRGWTADVLAVRNRDRQDWHDVEAAIAGVAVAGGGRRPATGRYVGGATLDVARGTEVGFAIREFSNSRGGRWATLTMRPTAAELTLVRGGVVCRASVAVAGPLD